MPRIESTTLPLILILAGVGFAQADKKTQTQEVYWHNWRGPNHDAIAPDANPPTEWNEADGKNIRWKVDVPGRGSSSPIVWKDQVFVSTAIETGEDGKPATAPTPPRSGGGRGDRRGRGGRGGRGRGSAPTKVHDFVVLAYNRKDGSIAWQTKVHSEVPHAGTHSTGTMASNSPLTDGERIYAHFGSYGIHCLDMKGDEKWSKQLGKMQTRNSFGEGSSPALHGDTLVVNWDHEGDSFVVALNKKTGKERWRKPRDEVTSWSTPLIVPVNGRPQVIIAATGATRAYDLKSGKVIWSISGMTTNCIPTPIYVDGVCYLMSGFRGSALQAIQLKGAKGKLDKSKKLLWSYEGRNTPYTPSGLVYGGNVYFVRGNDSFLTCLDAKTGKPHYEKERLDLGNIYSSLVGAAGRVYITGREGDTQVVKAGDKFEVISQNKLDDTTDATMAVVGDEIYVRGWRKLYCLGVKR